MYYCRNCDYDFDVIKRRPMIIPCGHTFCNICISESLLFEKKFECKNCTFIVDNPSHLIQNLIITDKNSMRTTIHSTSSTESKNHTFFHSDCRKRYEPSYAETQLNLIQKSCSSNGMHIESQTREDLFNGFKNIGFDKGLEIKKNLNKCFNKNCSKYTDRQFCSPECQNTLISKLKCQNQGCFKLSDQKFCSVFCSNSSNQSLTSFGHEQKQLGSLQRNLTPTTKVKPFGLPSYFSAQKSLLTIKPGSTLEKTRFGDLSFGKYKNSRCSRAGCFNNRHKGFGDEFWYCSINCYQFAEKKTFENMNHS